MKKALPESMPVEYWDETCFPVMHKLFACKPVKTDLNLTLSSNIKRKRRKNQMTDSLDEAMIPFTVIRKCAFIGRVKSEKFNTQTLVERSRGASQ